MSFGTISGKTTRLVVAVLIVTNIASIVALVWLATQNQRLRRQLTATPPSQVSVVLTPTTDSQVYDAAQRGQLERLKAVLDERPDLLNSRPYRNLSTPLHAAVFYQRDAIVRELLARKADVNATNRGGLIPLHDCVHRGTAEIAAMLLDHGASLTARTTEGLTPLEYALAKNRPDMADFLRERGAKE